MRPTLPVPVWAWVAIAVAVTWFLFVASCIVAASISYFGWQYHYSQLMAL